MKLKKCVIKLLYFGLISPFLQLLLAFKRFTIFLGYILIGLLIDFYSFSRSFLNFVKSLFLSRIFYLGGIFMCLIGIFLFAQDIYQFANDLPDPDLLIEKGTRGTTKILDKNGATLYEIYEDRRYDPVDLDQIPSHVVLATLAIEDSEFFNHFGFRPTSMLRAVRAYVKDHRVEGASTITQQLIKNVLLSPERTFDRKMKELVLSVMVERRYTKSEILELYLNNISYGGTAWGIESASQKFFGKSVGELSLGEASLLAGLPSAPSIYSPLNGGNDLAKARQKLVLQRMVDLNFISQEQADQAFDEVLEFAPQADFIRAPHFVFYVRSLLEEKFGKRLVTEGGLTVITTLDLDMQDRVQELVKEGVEKNSYVGLTNGAAVVLDPKTGGILAYVGSVDFFQEDWGAFDVVQAERQPGSAIKPITYALALSNGYTLASTINDSPVSYAQQGQAPYKPVNYDGKYHGLVTLRQSLANSYNIPAVKLADKVGPENIADLGIKMGLKSWENHGGYYGLAITLGGKEVKLLELANTYGTLARGGKYLPVNPLLSVKDMQGNDLLELAIPKEQVLDPGVAFLISDTLADNNARSQAFGLHSPLNIAGKTVAVKTGTTDNKRDNWTFGYTPSYVVGVWVGNNNNSAMNGYLASGLTGAAPIWNSIMTAVLEDVPNEIFVVPENVFLKVDASCGRKEYFLEGSSVPKFLCPAKNKKQE
ncbi:transglycosylase domain-containing protein [Patescibacteria group bacterium]|nr:transglycosylase domain-containing protein [Patescibacteria group bacterium]